jgi:hypothetical protein
VSYLDNILQQLKDHPVPPPADIADAIHKNIAAEKKEAEENAPLESIGQLRDSSIAPPAFLLDNIVAAKPKTNSAKVIPFRKYFTAAAAVLLVIVAIALLTRLSGKKEATQKELVHQSTGSQPVYTAPLKKDPVGFTVIEKNVDEVDKIPSQNNKKSVHHRVHKISGTATIDDADFAIRENDLLYSFTSFNYNNLPAFITNENTEAVKVRIDRSASITLSEGMVGMMKRMYQQKRNGKPTAKARREKRKLQRWKNADAKFFDKNVEKNPMDPLDLAEFIF